jgi:hypothetical protein
MPAAYAGFRARLHAANQRSRGGVSRMREHPAGEERKPQLDLVAPTGMNGRVVDVEAAAVATAEFGDVLAVVGIEVVPDHMARAGNGRATSVPSTR